MKHESLINRIASAITGNKIAVVENLFYDTLKGNLDFAPDDIPNVRAVLSLLGNSFSVPFSAQTGIVINWQSDTPPDQDSTYFELFNNSVEAFVYFLNSPGGQPYTWTLDGSSNVLVVTFDWGISQSGYIKFKI